MAGPRAERAKNVCDLTADALRLTEEHRRVQITLQRNAISDEPARAPNIDGPVETHPVRANRGYILQPHAAAFGEDDAWHALVVAPAHALRDNALQICE